MDFVYVSGLWRINWLSANEEDKERDSLLIVSLSTIKAPSLF